MNAPVEKFISRIIKPSQSAEALKTWSKAPGKVFRILVEWNNKSLFTTTIPSLR